MALSEDYKKKLQFIMNQMENRNQFFQILDQILMKVQFYQLPLHKITQILKLLEMPEVSDPGQIKYNTFVGINKLYQKFKDKIALHIYQDKFSHISKQMKELLYIVFQNIYQMMVFRQNSSLNMSSYYNMPYIYSGMQNMQPRMIPDPYYMNSSNISNNNSILKDQNVQNPLLNGEEYKAYYQDQAKNYYAMMQQNSQIMSSPFLVPVPPNIQKNISPSNVTMPSQNQNMMPSNKAPIVGNTNSTIGGNNILSNGPPNYPSTSIGQYPQPYGSYMDYMKAYQTYIQQNSYIYTQNNSQRNVNMMYKGYQNYQPVPDNISQMLKKNMYSQQKQSIQKLDQKKKNHNQGKFFPQIQNQKVRNLLPQNPTLNPKQNIPASSINFSNAKKPLPPIRNQIPNQIFLDPQVEIVPKSNINLKGQKRLMQQNKQFQFCACKGYSAHQDNFTCCLCKRNFHNKCLNQTVRKSEQSKSKVECSLCKIGNIDPLNKVQRSIGQYFLVNLPEQKFQTTVNFKQFQHVFYPQKNPKYQIEMRCIRAGDHLDHLQITWPDQCVIKINGQKIIDIPALQSNSSLKKRKDYAVLLTQNIYGKHVHESSNILQKVRISLEIKNLTPQQLHQKKIKNDHTFVLGIYLIQRLNIDELYQKVTKETESIEQKEDYFKYLMFANQNSQENQVQIEQITINLFDPFSWQLIKLPVRGSRCHHGSCFDLKTFISFMSTAKNRNWKCPICGKDARKFIIDNQQQQILRKAAQLNPIPKQACVFKDSTIAFKIDNQSDDQSQKQKKMATSQLGKTKKIVKQKKEDSR